MKRFTYVMLVGLVLFVLTLGGCASRIGPRYTVRHRGPSVRVIHHRQVRKPIKKVVIKRCKKQKKYVHKKTHVQRKRRGQKKQHGYQRRNKKNKRGKPSRRSRGRSRGRA